MRHLLAFLLLCLLVPLVQASTPPAEQWFSVLLDGRKIGSFHLQREARGEQVRTTQTLDITLERAGIRIGLRSSESASETRTGMPLAFESRSQLSGVEQRIQGRIVDGTIQLTTSSAGNSQSRDMAWPKGAVLSEGARLAGLRAGLKPGTRYEVLAFQPSGLDSVQLATVVGAREHVDLPGGARELSRIEQTMRMPLGTLQSTSWVDAQQTIHKMTLPLMGTQLVLLACDRACATAPNQDSDVFERTLLAAPRALGAAELGGTLRYTLTGGNGSDLVATAEQQVERRGAQQVVVVRAQAQAGGAVAPPSPRTSPPTAICKATPPRWWRSRTARSARPPRPHSRCTTSSSSCAATSRTSHLASVTPRRSRSCASPRAIAPNMRCWWRRWVAPAASPRAWSADLPTRPSLRAGNTCSCPMRGPRHSSTGAGVATTRRWGGSTRATSRSAPAMATRGAFTQASASSAACSLAAWRPYRPDPDGRGDAVAGWQAILLDLDIVLISTCQHLP